MIDRGEIQGELAAIRTSVGSLTFYEQSGHEQRLLEIADALLAELEQVEQRLHTEQRDRNWWAANNSRERARAEARLAKADTVLVEALRMIQAKQPEMVETFRSHGIVFDGPLGNDPDNWQHVAFTVYAQLCEAESFARAALADWEQS